MHLNGIINKSLLYAGTIAICSMLAFNASAKSIEVQSSKPISIDIPKGTKFKASSNGKIIGISDLDGSFLVINKSGEVEHGGKIRAEDIPLPTDRSTERSPVIVDFSLDVNGDIYVAVGWWQSDNLVNHGIAVFDESRRLKQFRNLEELHIGSMALGSDSIFIEGVTYGKKSDSRIHQLDKSGNLKSSHFPFTNDSSWRERSAEVISSKLATNYSRRNDIISISKSVKSKHKTLRGLMGNFNNDSRPNIIDRVITPSKPTLPDAAMTKKYGEPIESKEINEKVAMLSDGTVIVQSALIEFYVNGAEKRPTASTRRFIEIIRSGGETVERIETDLGKLVGVDESDNLYFLSPKDVSRGVKQGLQDILLVTATLK